ncbi:hypothetical protein BDR04DRAFT_1100274 [Suillus decipiens]|nr:hypothetical protein BDR04DRAFT_1100274 [Suillus decipiens]
MSTTETEDTSFKTVFLINLVANKLKEANLTIAPPTAEDYVTYLRAVLATYGIRSPKKKTYGFKYIYLVSKP